jgi:hypothetical protein
MKKFGLLISSLFLTTQLVWGQTTIYLHDFGTTTITEYPYTVAPTVFDSHFSNSSWTNSNGAWTSYSGSSGQAISLSNSGGTPSITLTFSVEAGYQVDITAFSFWRQRSSTGAQNWSMAINSTSVGSGTVPTTGSNTGALTPDNSVSGLTGTITVVLSLSGATGTGTFRLDDFNLTGNVTSLGTPNLSLSLSSLSGFSYIEGNGPSASQSYDLSGTNLDGNDVTITAPTDYEVSLDNTNWYTSRTLTSFDGASTTIYVRLKADLSAGTYNGETISNAGGGATTVNVTCNGTVYKQEPTNYATGFSAAVGTPDYSSIDLNWTDATGGTVPDGYLIKASDVSLGSITDPVDGTVESNSTLVKNVAQGNQTASFIGLSASTTYYFKIYPYTNSGININYKSDSTVPSTSLATGSAPAASLLLEENFDFSGLLTSNGWTAHSSGGTNPISTTTGLTYTDYPSSGMGNAALLNNTGEDVNRTFTTQTTGFIYYSFLVNVTTGTAGYFIHLGTGTSTFAARVFVQPSINSGKINFGVSNSSTAVYGTTDFDPLTTYLLIVKYEVANPTSNVSLWVKSSGLPSTETAAGTPEVTTTTGTGLASINAIYLRQYSTSQDITVDGIRIGTSWGFAPLPVELTSFSASVIGSKVKLNWATATEVNNYGFDILRQAQINKGSWEKVGFISGSGNSNLPSSYSFIDNNVTFGKYNYRLKQIDNDGQFEYSKTVEADLGAPKNYELNQNYPNPFNPTTTISFKLPEASQVKLTVYNILGQEVKVLIDEFKEAGLHTINFKAEDLNSGLYIYKLQAGSFTQTRKMTLIK